MVERDATQFRLAKESGNGAHVYLPASWVGKPVKITPIESTNRDGGGGESGLINREAKIPDELDAERFAGPREQLRLQFAPRMSRQGGSDTPPISLGEISGQAEHAVVSKESLHRNMLITGRSAYGKSTLMRTIAKQLIEAGDGICYIDPVDAATSLGRVVPEDRMDDVVWLDEDALLGVEPGVNWLDVTLPQDDPDFEQILPDLVAAVKKMFETGGQWDTQAGEKRREAYWGAQMDTLTRVMIKAMVEFNCDHPEEAALKLEDMYYIISESSDPQAPGSVEQLSCGDFIQEYHPTAELSMEQMEQCLGRMENWLEDIVTRETSPDQVSGVDLSEAVANGKIVIVELGPQPDQVKKEMMRTTMCRVYAAARARRITGDDCCAPFHLFLDGAQYMSDEKLFEELLSDTQSIGLSIITAVQQLDQMGRRTSRALLANTSTVVSFNPGAKSDNQPLERLDVDEKELFNLPRYQAHVHQRVADQESETDESEQFVVDTHRPFPPLRTPEELYELISD